MTDRAAAEEFVRRLGADHGTDVYRWARGRFADERDAEEVVAETLLRAWRHHAQFDPDRGSERAWLFGIARNTAVDHHRGSRRHLRAVPTEVLPEQGEADTTDRLVEESVVRDALGDLTDAHRDVLIAVHFGGLSIAEAAAKFDIAEGTIKSRLYYALRSLRAGLEERGILS